MATHEWAAPGPRGPGDLTLGSWSPPEVQLRCALTPGRGRNGTGWEVGGHQPHVTVQKHSWLSPGRAAGGPQDYPTKRLGGAGALCPSPWKDGEATAPPLSWPGLAVLGVSRGRARPRSAVPRSWPSAAVSEARLVAEPESRPLLRGSGALPVRSPALRLRPPAALRTRSGLTSNP